jgi:hypothetical protein
MVRMEDLKPLEIRLVFAEACAQLRAEPTYLAFLNQEEKKVMEFILGDTWAKLVHSLSITELETIFYEKVPSCPDLRLLGKNSFNKLDMIFLITYLELKISE